MFTNSEDSNYLEFIRIKLRLRLTLELIRGLRG